MIVSVAFCFVERYAPLCLNTVGPKLITTLQLVLMNFFVSFMTVFQESAFYSMKRRSCLVSSGSKFFLDTADVLYLI